MGHTHTHSQKTVTCLVTYLTTYLTVPFALSGFYDSSDVWSVMLLQLRSTFENESGFIPSAKLLLIS